MHVCVVGVWYTLRSCVCVSHISMLEIIYVRQPCYVCFFEVVCLSCDYVPFDSHLMCLEIACVSLYMHVFSKWHVCREK